MHTFSNDKILVLFFSESVLIWIKGTAVSSFWFGNFTHFFVIFELLTLEFSFNISSGLRPKPQNCGGGTAVPRIVSLFYIWTIHEYLFKVNEIYIRFWAQIKSAPWEFLKTFVTRIVKPLLNRMKARGFLVNLRSTFKNTYTTEQKTANYIWYFLENLLFFKIVQFSK